MTRYFALSSFLHLTVAALALVILGAPVKEPTETYIINFIGSGKVVSMQTAKTPDTTQTTAPAETAPAAKPEPQKPAPKAYDSKAEISAKKQTKKQSKPAPAPLAAPSILEEDKNTGNNTDTSSNTLMGSGAEDFEGGSIQTDFSNFPDPWYITQMRNSIWSEWEKRRRGKGNLETIIVFSVLRNGQIKNLQIVKSSEDKSFDFLARTAIETAGPFRPLPMLFEKDILTVTVSLKQER